MVLLPSIPSDLETAPACSGLPPGCKTFGSELSSAELTHWLKPWRDRPLGLSLLLVLAGSRTAEVDGISAAGLTAASRRYTAVADAELLLHGPKRLRQWPLPPLAAGVSPALISYVAAQSIGIDPLVAAVGLPISPPFPHLRLEASGLGPAACLSTGQAMDQARVDALWKRGWAIGRGLRRPLVLAECVPGGTTTAQAVLSGFGLSVADLVSGSVHKPPRALKQELVDRGLRLAGLASHSHRTPTPQRLIAAVGDPFQPVAAGLLMGARVAQQPVLLAGGSQMLAVLALALAAVEPDQRQDLARGVTIGTTAWLASEVIPSQDIASEAIDSDVNRASMACLVNRVGDHFGVRLFGLAAGLRFHGSRHQALRDYELGHVKEGVGAGALAFLAQLYGSSSDHLVVACDQAMDQLQDASASAASASAGISSP